MKRFNSSVIMSGAEYFDDSKAINILMDSAVPVNAVAAIAEHTAIKTALEDAGVIVFKTTTPKGLQDGVYVANWFVERNGRALMARLPNTRRPEEAYALVAAREAGLDTLNLPENIERFSGQGDALACGDVIFTHSPYRTVKAAHDYLKSWLGFTEIVALETKPARKFGNWGPRITNRVTGLPDSPTYDLDLALAILKWPDEEQKGLIAWCPKVFTRKSRALLSAYENVDKIEVSKKEALGAFALNLVSTGETVIMNTGAPEFAAALSKHDLKVVTLDLPELKKGGGSIRCSTVTVRHTSSA